MSKDKTNKTKETLREKRYELLADKGFHYYQQGKYDKAIKYLTKGINGINNSRLRFRSFLLCVLSECYKMKCNFNESFWSLYKALKETPTFIEVHLCLIDSLKTKALTPKALFGNRDFVNLEKKLNTENDFASNIIVSVIRALKNDFDGMDEHLRRASEIDPENPYLLYYFGIYHSLNKEYSEALNLYEKFDISSTELDPLLFDYYYFKGPCCYSLALDSWKKGAVEKAQKILSDSIELADNIKVRLDNSKIDKLKRLIPTLGFLKMKTTLFNEIIFLDSKFQKIFKTETFNDLFSCLLETSYFIEHLPIFLETMKAEGRDALKFSEVFIAGSIQVFCTHYLLGSLKTIFPEEIEERPSSRLNLTEFRYCRDILLELGFIKGKQAIDAIENFISMLLSTKKEEIRSKEKELITLLKPAYVLDGELSQFMAEKQLREGQFQSLRDFIQENTRKSTEIVIATLKTIIEPLERELVKRPEPKEERLEINFEKGKIKIGSTVKSKYKQIFELLEYFINKGEDVHWIEGIRIFDDWKKIRNDIYNLKTIFEVIISRLRGPKGFFRNNNLNLDITNLDKGFYRLEGSYSSNIIKARELTREAELLIDTGEFNIEEVKQKIKGAIEIYGSCSEAHILMIKLLKDNIESEKDMIPVRRFFTKQIQFLGQVKSTVEYYKNNLQKIEWEKLRPTEEREEVQQEFKNEVGFFLIAVQQDLDEMKIWFDSLTKWSETKSLSLPTERGFKEVKKLLEQNKIQDLLKTDIIKQLWGITRGILINRLPYIRKWKDKKIDNYVTGILSDAIDNAKENIDFSKVSSLRSLRKYLLKLIKDAIYQDFFERIGLTKAEWKDYKEVERIKEELRQKFGREPEEEEWQELLLEKKKRGGEYLEYIKEICNKAKAIVSLRWDIASKEDEESSENDIEKSDYAEGESEE